MAPPGDLARRLWVAAVGLPVVIVCLWFGGWALGVLVTVGGVLGMHEFCAISSCRGARPFSVVASVAVAALILATTARPQIDTLVFGGFWLLLGLALILSGAAVWLRPHTTAEHGAVSSTLFGVMYVGLPLALIPVLHALPAQLGVVSADTPLELASFVVLPLAVMWVGDSTAYFVGSAIGKTRLAPAVSPKKSVEGAVAGLVGSIAAAAVVAYLGPAHWPTSSISIGTSLWMGALIGAAGQVGDLVESALKREAGVKDSGTLLPGHGGVLDRLDALLFAMPATWLALFLAGIARFS